jgi:hypothetical protein
MNELDRRSLLKVITPLRAARHLASLVKNQYPLLRRTLTAPDIRIKPPALTATWISKS